MLSTYFLDICQHYNLPELEFSGINLSSCGIKIITQLPTKLLFISQLYLDSNLIQSLSGIQQFMNLQILSLNFNFISQSQQLTKVNNKFLIRELSFIGNPIQHCLQKDQLKNGGFYNLIFLNDVKLIGNIKAMRCVVLNHRDLLSHNSHLFDNSKPYLGNKGQNISQTHHRHQYELNQSNHYNHDTHQQSIATIQGTSSQYNNQTLNSSRFVYLTKRQPTLRTSKRPKDFQSTGDTRKQKLSSFRGVQQNSPLRNLIKSPNFNYELNQQSYDHSYRKSLPNRKVTEFNLYPVDQQLNRSRNINNLSYQNERYDTVKSKRNQQQMSVNSFKKIDSLSRTIQYQKRVNPFKESLQRQYPLSEQQRYPNYYRSQIYQLQHKKMANQHWQNQQQQKIISQNNQTAAFQLIQQQIPIYKQAIGIAFYYRNLLEKVFRGFQTLRHRQMRLKSQGSSYSSQSNRRKLGINNQIDKQRLIIGTSEQIKHQGQDFSKSRQQQVQLLRYAWMKIEVYSNYLKIMEKYQSSNKKPR